MNNSDAKDRPLRVAVTANIPMRNPELLCPGRVLRWGRCEFSFNPPGAQECDFWIVSAGTPPLARMICAPENTLFAAGEPPIKKVYPRKFYAQFHHVLNADAAPAHPRVITSMLPLNWMVGFDTAQGAFRYGYDELARQAAPQKELKLSVVCSSLRTTKGQRLRLNFLNRLKERLGDRLVHFGRGFTPIGDKMDAIAPYHYHLVLENSTGENYWTEKLADAFLGWAFPLYLGCPNLENYFPREAFARVDPQQFEQTVRRIEEFLSAPPPPAVQEAIRVSRNRMLNQYNFFGQLAGWAEKLHQPGSPARLITIRSHNAFRFPAGLFFRWKNRGYQPGLL